ncbi:MAG: cupin domain-containing protein [Pseudomonadales bacterium]|nr:cupin domain-containing protein [Pseudomonadales bacterium]
MIDAFDVENLAIDIYPDFSISTRNRKPGPPERVAGMTFGYIDTDQNAPHNGEVHPDGDELLVVIDGRVEVHFDSQPDGPCVLTAGMACIVPKGEWHKVMFLERSKFIHVTPGPNGDWRR